jgi:competence protein ComFA
MGESVDESISFLKPEKSDAIINYELSADQKRIASSVLDNFKNHINVLIYAVCGAGKTELVFKVIEYALRHSMRVGFAVPRRDVIIELAIRFQKTFKNNVVTSVFGGNTKLLNGDIICLTTHQLYRYPAYFDLLILDEIDAFPYHGNEVLKALAKRSVKGNYVLMSATPDKATLEEFSKPGHITLNLFTRYHRHPLPIPKVKVFPKFILLICLVKQLKIYREQNKPCLVFVPTISMCEDLFKITKSLVKGGYFVHSKEKERTRIIEKFRAKEYKYLITTAVLERGVTLKNLQVIIFCADDQIYNSASLIQISGRVGRVKGAEGGDVYYYATKKTAYIDEAISFTKRANSYL